MGITFNCNVRFLSMMPSQQCIYGEGHCAMAAPLEITNTLVYHMLDSNFGAMAPPLEIHGYPLGDL